MRKILLTIPISAAVIGGMVAYKLTRPQRSSDFPAAAVAATVRQAPLFQLYDEHSEIVRLARYVGRHKLLVVFFDGTRGPDRSELLQQLRRDFSRIHETGAILLAISALRPSEHRYGLVKEAKSPQDDERGTTRPPESRLEREQEMVYPFPLLSDIDYQVHQQWGAYNVQTDRPHEAAFVVDRGGVIRHAHVGPDHLGTAADWVAHLRSVR